MQFRNPLFAVVTVALMSSLPGCESGTKEEPVAEKPADAKDAKDTKDTKDAPAAADPEAQKEADTVLAAGTDGMDPKVAKAVSIAREIEADPSKAEDVLGKYELDREGLDALMYEIARSPDLAKAYAAARMNS
jgi:hypothetical protein